LIPSTGRIYQHGTGLLCPHDGKSGVKDNGKLIFEQNQSFFQTVPLLTVLGKSPLCRFLNLLPHQPPDLYPIEKISPNRAS